MRNKTLVRLTEGQIYRFGDLLLEAACCDVWTLNLLNNLGEEIPVADGALVAYELRADGQWDSVHCSISPLLPEEEICTFSYGDTVKIDPNQLIFVANCRSDLYDILREQEFERQIRQVMATIEL